MSARSTNTSRLRFGAYEFEPRAGELRKQGIRIRLEGQPLVILTMLLDRPGELITRDELQKRLWSADTFVDFDHSLNAAIKRLRAALSDSASAPRYIETLPGRGYRFMASLAPPPAVATPSDESSGAPRSQVPSRLRGLPSWLAIAAVLLAVALAAWGWREWRRRGVTPAPSAGIHSLVVLPLENLSGDPAQEYFSDGLTDELTTALAHLHNVRVISRTSAMRYKNEHKPLAQIAKELNVDAVVEGSVARSGDRVRVRTQLIRAASDEHIWAQAYERSLSDVLALQGQLAQDIAAEITGQVTPEQKSLLPSRRRVDPQTYEDYLKGLYYWNKYTEEALTKSLRYFRLAIQRDPSYAEAYAGLSASYEILGNFSVLRPNEAYPKAEAAAAKAVEIDDAFSEAHAQLGYVAMFYDRDWPRAQKEFQRALELNPSNANAHRGLAQYFLSNARMDSALAEIGRARELDPVSLNINFDQGWYLCFARRPDEAIAQLQKTLQMDPNFLVAHFGLGSAYEQKGAHNEAIKEFQASLAQSPDSTNKLGCLGHAYAMAGRTQEARSVLLRIKNLSARKYASPYHTALVYAGLGEKDAAFAWLEKAYEDHFWMMAFLKVDPRFDSLRSDARYADLVRRVGLEP